jgi:hypothetical protein
VSHGFEWSVGGPVDAGPRGDHCGYLGNMCRYAIGMILRVSGMPCPTWTYMRMGRNEWTFLRVCRFSDAKRTVS